MFLYNQRKNGGPAACHPKSQSPEADAGAKGKRLIQRLKPGRMEESRLKAHLLILPCKKSNHLQQGQDKSQYPEFLLDFQVQSSGGQRQLLSGLSPHTAGSQLLSISGSLLEPACGTRTAMGHAAARATWSCTLGKEHSNSLVSASPGGGGRERGSLQEAMGHMAVKAMWLLRPCGLWKQQVSTPCK